MVAGAVWVCGTGNWKLLAHSLADQEGEKSVLSWLLLSPFVFIWGPEPGGWVFPI